jgi:GT2 family glycosyltransferase
MRPAIGCDSRVIVTAFISTYRRPRDLQRCLDGLKRQSRAADQVIVAMRRDDTETRGFLGGYRAAPLPLEVVEVEAAGAIASYNAAFDAARGDIIAVTDDDAVPVPDWLERLAAGYAADPKIGALGGRDRIHADGAVIAASAARVGVFTWWGGLIGKHHLGLGPARDVDLLKGANMSFRRAALGDLRMDARLRGAGAQYFQEASLCLSLRRRGWRVVYDPAILVDHFPAAPVEYDHRDHWDRAILHDRVHNVAYVRLAYDRPPRTLAWLLFSLAVGFRGGGPGLLNLILMLLVGRFDAPGLFAAHLGGLWAGWRTARAARAGTNA